MITKTRAQAHDSVLEPQAGKALPGPEMTRQRSGDVQETLRQLAEITERFASGSLSDASTGQPSAAAIAPPTASALKGLGRRDGLALATMAHVRQRARVQQDESREMFKVFRGISKIDPDYVPQHAADTLHLTHVGAAGSWGTRPYQQDIAVADWRSKDAIPVAAVCDGHGTEKTGDLVPWHWLQKHLIPTLRAHLPAPGEAAAWAPHQVYKALTRAIDGSRKRPNGPLSVVEQMAQVNAVENGSTLNAAVRIGNRIYLVNVGDSRAVLVRRDGSAHQLTVDHKIDEPQEWEMVQNRVAAGRASMAETSPGIYRMLRHAAGGAVYGIAMSRSIGDDQATMSTPEISMFDVGADDVALVMCSDGVFDSVHNDQLGEYVSAIMSRSREPLAARCQRAAAGLVGYCYDTEMLHEKADADVDNLTVLVLPLHEEA